MKLKKGSAAAKAYMAKIRGMKGKKKPTKKVAGYVKTIRKGSATNVLYSNSTKKAVRKSDKPKQGTLFGANKDRRINGVNVHGFSGSDIISMDQIGKQLWQYERDLMQLAANKKNAKGANEKKQIADIQRAKNAQFKALKAYLNTRAKFV